MGEDRVQVFLETDRLLLRRLTEADLDNLFDLDSDPEVMRFLSGGTPTPREVVQDEILPRFLRSYERFPGYGYWAAVERSTGTFLGWVGLVPRDGDSSGDLHLGYRLRRSAWGKGYATEAARALIRKAFAELGAQRVIATTYQDNLASRRVMEKAGMALVRSYRLTPADLAWQIYNLNQTQNMPALQSVYKKLMTSYKPALFGGQPILQAYYKISMGIPAHRSDKYTENIQGFVYGIVSDAFKNHQSNAQIWAALKKQVHQTYPGLKGA